MNLFFWIGIVLCLSQSAMLSGLNLAIFTISKFELQMEVTKDNKNARRVIAHLKVKPEHSEDDVIDHYVILLWNDTRRTLPGVTFLEDCCGASCKIPLLTAS